jgi:hypothetical protein
VGSDPTTPAKAPRATPTKAACLLLAVTPPLPTCSSSPRSVAAAAHLQDPSPLRGSSVVLVSKICLCRAEILPFVSAVHLLLGLSLPPSSRQMHSKRITRSQAILQEHPRYRGRSLLRCQPGHLLRRSLILAPSPPPNPLLPSQICRVF